MNLKKFVLKKSRKFYSRITYYFYLEELTAIGHFDETKPANLNNNEINEYFRIVEDAEESHRIA